MAGFDHSNTILVLTPVGPDASEALRSKPNASRLFSLHYPGSDSTTSLSEHSESRECTPYVVPPPQIQLHLKVDPIPKNPLRGFVFGVEETICDIVLLENPIPGRENSFGISRQHFGIGFNWTSGYAVVNGISRAGTTIVAPSIKDGLQHLKQGVKRALYPGEQTRIRAGALEFDIVYPVRDLSQRQLYQRNWAFFKAKCLGAPPKMDTLNLESTQEITNIVCRRGKGGGTYKIQGEIGAGVFGVVREAVRDGDGALFAAKDFIKETVKPFLEIKMIKQIDHVRPYLDSHLQTCTDVSPRNISSNTRTNSKR